MQDYIFYLFYKSHLVFVDRMTICFVVNDVGSPVEELVFSTQQSDFHVGDIVQIYRDDDCPGLVFIYITLWLRLSVSRRIC